MGDPECQVILPRLKTNLLKIFKFLIKDNLNKIKIKWSKEKSMTIVLCSKGYPYKYKKNFNLNNIKELTNSKKLYTIHAGTKLVNNKIISNGGRVLNITKLGNSYKVMRKIIISHIKKISNQNLFFRKDIGWRVINKS